jgi:NAD dependent epimerase/dehydratase family enzyme
VTNRAFTKALGKVLGRPTIARAPGWAVRAALGQMGRELLLSSARVVPAALQASGFRYVHPELEMALCNELGVCV